MNGWPAPDEGKDTPEVSNRTQPDVNRASACVVVVAPSDEAPLDLWRVVLEGLRDAGWTSTVLDASHAFNVFRLGQAEDAYRALADVCGADYRVLPLDGRPQPIEPMGSFQSYFVYEFVKRENPALIVGDVLFGALHHVFNARQAGVALTDARVLLLAGGTTELRLEQREELPTEPVVLAQDFLERAGVARADALLAAAASEPLVWLLAAGWALPPVWTVSRDTPWPSPEGAPPPAPAVPAGDAPPRVSVCLTHHERPQCLRRAVASLAAQTYSNLEVVLVDDGSTDAESLACLASLEPDFAARGWRLVRQANAYLGAARNTAVRHATGAYFLFMDDDNVAHPHEVETFVRAALRTGADILTCFYDGFEGATPPATAADAAYRLVVAGGPVACGVFTNCWGDANALVRREAFARAGGFTTLRGVGAEDHEFFARAALAGCRFAVVPEALYWYRVSPSGMRLAGSEYRNARRALTPYREHLSADLAPLLDLAPGWRLQRLRDLEHLRQAGVEEARLRAAHQQAQTALAAAEAERDHLLAEVKRIRRSWWAALWLPWTAPARARRAARRTAQRQ